MPAAIHFLEKEIHKKEALTNLIAKHLVLSVQDCIVHPYRYSAENEFNQRVRLLALEMQYQEEIQSVVQNAEQVVPELQSLNFREAAECQTLRHSIEKTMKYGFSRPKTGFHFSVKPQRDFQAIKVILQHIQEIEKIIRI